MSNNHVKGSLMLSVLPPITFEEEIMIEQMLLDQQLARECDQVLEEVTDRIVSEVLASEQTSSYSLRADAYFKLNTSKDRWFFGGNDRELDRLEKESKR